MFCEIGSKIRQGQDVVNRISRPGCDVKYVHNVFSIYILLVFFLGLSTLKNAIISIYRAAHNLRILYASASNAMSATAQGRGVFTQHKQAGKKILLPRAAICRRRRRLVSQHLLDLLLDLRRQFIQQLQCSHIVMNLLDFGSTENDCADIWV